MIAVLQRVASASVTVPATGYAAAIGPGLLILLGLEKGDGEAEIAWGADKCAHLRIFMDAQEKMNLSVKDAGGSALVISQFTLAGDCSRGRRPGFDRAAPPEAAQPLYERFCDLLEQAHGVPVRRGVFRARMQVSLVNDGPVTVIVERSPTPDKPGAIVEPTCPGC